MSRPTFVTIDLNALTHNLLRVRTFAKNCHVIAMVKANAYGHGIVRAAKALSSADALGVASLDEAICLREAGITTPIVLMEGVFYEDELKEAAKHQLSLVVHHLPHIEILEKIKVEKPFSIWLKINTGMHRLGFMPADVPKVYERLLNAPACSKPIGLMTHFAEADFPQSDATNEQIKLFTNTVSTLTGPKSLANSAGILAWPTSHADWVRPGLILYGASPFSDRIGADYGLKAVMTLHSKLIAINFVKQGCKIGYGGTWTAPEDMIVGVVGVGYGDGYPQFAENGTPVLVANQETQLIGRVSMDMLTVDLRPIKNPNVGDKVILWGDGLAVERVAKYSKTSAYEILTRMTPRPKIETKD